MFFLVEWILRISFMLERAVDEHGAGCVVRNIVVCITTRRVARNYLLLRTITPSAVGKRLDSRRKTIALGDIIRIVLRGGRPRSGQPRAKP